MIWEDERYVRLYVRDTVEWNMLPWQSRALWPLLLRKLDRAGVIELGKYGVRGLAELVKLPVEVVDPGLAGLLEDGCVVAQGTQLVARNFIEAQEATASDAARAKAYRERKRAEALSVTERDEPSRNVTQTSRVVTSRHEANESSLCTVPSVPSESLSPARKSSPDQLWLDAVGVLPGAGLLEAWNLAKQAAPAKGLSPEEYFSKALGAFVQWVDGVRGVRRPQKSPLKFVEHFARVQEILDGKREAVPAETPLPQRANEPVQRKYEDLGEVAKRIGGT